MMSDLSAGTMTKSSSSIWSKKLFNVKAATLTPRITLALSSSLRATSFVSRESTISPIVNKSSSAISFKR